MQSMVADSVSAHPQVKEKVHVYRQVLSDQAIAGSGWKPSIDLQASTGIYQTESPATGNETIDYNSSQLALSVTQNLFDGFDTSNQVDQTRARAQAALFDIYDQADNIALDSIQAYLDVLKQRRLMQLATENVASHESILERIRERNNSGVGRKSQLQQTEGRVALAQASLVAQQNNLDDSVTTMHQVLGRYLDPAQMVDPELPELPEADLDHLIDTTLQVHPAMIVALNNIKAARFNHKRAKSELYPDLDLRFASEWGDDLGGVEGNTEDLSLILNLTYNFYDGGADRSEIQKRISAVYEQKEFAALVRRQIINTLRLAWVADQSLLRQLVFLQQHVDKARETVASYREEFFIGQRDLIDLLDAENELNSAQNEYTGAYYDGLAARYRVFEATGQLFPALKIESLISDDDFVVARVQANQIDELPLPDDEDQDEEKDVEDHCDNSIAESEVNEFGCELAGEESAVLEQDDSDAVDAVNMAPIAQDDAVEVEANQVLTLSQQQLLENDIDADGDSLEVSDLDSAQHGNVAFDEQQNIIYRPEEGFAGLDQFVYTVTDSEGNMATAQVQISVIEPLTIDLSSIKYLNFIYDSTALTDASLQRVDDIVNQIKRAGEVFIEVYTHTDSIGPRSFNDELSAQRAVALKQLLVEKGLPADHIKAQGLGEGSPIADNDSDEGRAINRRAEFVFIMPDESLQ